MKARVLLLLLASIFFAIEIAFAVQNQGIEDINLNGGSLG